jgi:hypothetical protein
MVCIGSTYAQSMTVAQWSRNTLDPFHNSYIVSLSAHETITDSWACRE